MLIALVVVVVIALIAFFLLKKKPEATSPRAAEPGARDGEGASRKVGASPKGPERKTDAASAQRDAGESAVRSGAGARVEAAPRTAAPTSPTAAEAVEGFGAERDSGADAGETELLQDELETREASSPDAAPEAEIDEASPPPPPVRSPHPPGAARQAEVASLRHGLSRSREKEGFFGRLRALVTGRKDIPAELSEEIEELLLTSDVGVATTNRILERVKENLSRAELSTDEKVLRAVREEARRTLAVEGTAGAILVRERPTVVLFVGVNGAGKTTTIGKLAQKLTSEGKRVMLSAGDTFRAAAVEQLKAWGERTGCQVVTGKPDADPSSVLFDAIIAAKEAGVDVLLADTAGRLHTKTNLMQEMTKIAKTANKALPGAPHEVFLVIDATNGQNAMAQAKEFRESLPLTGLVLTKLDGTARGGVVLGICDTLKVPVRYVGMGEKVTDLHEFDPTSFVEALLGGDEDEIAA